MPTPEFILELRRHIGNAPLWLMGANALILRGDEVLLARRADNGLWAPISGIVDPGENPAETAVREAMEEAGVEVAVDRMLWLVVTEQTTYSNGDVTQYVDHGFRCRWVSGDPHPADGEATEAAWFPVDALPEPRQDRLDEMVRIAIDNPRDVVLSFSSD